MESQSTMFGGLLFVLLILAGIVIWGWHIVCIFKFFDVSAWFRFSTREDLKDLKAYWIYSRKAYLALLLYLLILGTVWLTVGPDGMGLTKLF